MRGLVQRLRAFRGSDRARLIVLTLYYVAIIGGVFFVHLMPDSKATPFVYQAF